MQRARQAGRQAGREGLFHDCFTRILFGQVGEIMNCPPTWLHMSYIDNSLAITNKHGPSTKYMASLD